MKKNVSVIVLSMMFSNMHGATALEKKLLLLESHFDQIMQKLPHYGMHIGLVGLWTSEKEEIMHDPEYIQNKWEEYAYEHELPPEPEDQDKRKKKIQQDKFDSEWYETMRKAPLRERLRAPGSIGEDARKEERMNKVRAGLDWD